MLNNQSTSKICTHMTSLNKNAITQYLQSNIIMECNHPSHQYSCICLHCGKSFCGLSSQNDCLINHQQINKDHVMTLSIETFIIFCKQCNDDLQSLIQEYNGDKEVSQYKRSLRFVSYIKQLWMKSQKIHLSNDQQHQMLHLVNLGNTCFLNVVLQLLNATEPLVKFYRSFKFQSGQKTSYKLLTKEIEMYYSELLQKRQSEQWHIVGKKKQKQRFVAKHQNKDCSLNKAFRWMIISTEQKNHSQNESFAPTDILSKISQCEKKYTQKKQQDADQLLNFIIDWLSEGQLLSINYNKQKYDKIQKILGKQKISISQHIFGTYLASRLVCNQCRKITWTLDLTYQLAVESKKQVKDHSNDKGQINFEYWQPLKYPKNQQINPLIRSFFSQQTLTKFNNYYQCANCSSLTASKKLFIVSPPQILIITIKRFLGMKKYNDFIEFSLNLDLSGVTLDRQVVKYQLYAVICHQGNSINTGHYFCYIKSRQDWLWCSDEQVRKVQWREVKKQQAYILGYKKIEQK